MCPQFVDFDGDGNLDIVTATYDGSPHLALGREDDFGAPARMLDAKGDRIMLTQHWCYESTEWKEIGTPHCTSAVAFDWDDDGDFDLLLGAYEGGLYLQRNEGKPGEPAFTGTNVSVEAGGEPLMVPGGLTAPRLVDWNEDGLLDIVCGSFEGGVFLYRNVGELGEPRFDAAETLIPQSEGSLDAKGAPNSGCYADAVDADGDGDLDLVVGGYCKWTPNLRPLTDEETARVADLEEELRGTSEKINALFEALEEQSEESAEELVASPEAVKLLNRMQQIREELAELRPGTKREAGVWLYARE